MDLLMQLAEVIFGVDSYNRVSVPPKRERHRARISSD